ncbi:hypothetical protein AVEN_216770-1 [Araneus ventricosus]|uniref:Uncharacterized protein n=1 Tax=Araneus ventricosus TaxID=182803 RepID=A0A4Y2JNE3_ARAVE|nr:hypothetical protein AVEN_216770-1 [Araneus ventricosus]
MEQSSASIENFQISSDFTFHEDVNLGQNIVIHLSFSGHMSVNSPIPGTSTNETNVSPEVVQPSSSKSLQIMKRIRKRDKSASLTFTPKKQKFEEELLKISRKEKEKQQRSQFKFSSKLPKVKTKLFPEKSKKTYVRFVRHI